MQISLITYLVLEVSNAQIIDILHNFFMTLLQLFLLIGGP